MYQVLITEHFKKELKPLVKKFRHLKEDLLIELKNFSPKTAVHLAHNLYKLRVRCKNLPRGKSGAFRIIILLVEVESILVPVTLFFKSDRENIGAKELEHHLSKIKEELYLRP